MIDLTTPIIPYVGTGIFKLDSDYNKIKAILQDQNIQYEEEVSEATDVDPPWTTIIISKDGSPKQYSAIELVFAKKRLFKICLCEDFEGALPNGIRTGMNFKEAKKLDPTLQRDKDWDEVFISPGGYFVEYSNRTLDIIIITIFIPAVERDDFYEYKW